MVWGKVKGILAPAPGPGAGPRQPGGWQGPTPLPLSTAARQLSGFCTSNNFLPLREKKRKEAVLVSTVSCTSWPPPRCSSIWKLYFRPKRNQDPPRQEGCALELWLKEVSKQAGEDHSHPQDTHSQHSCPALGHAALAKVKMPLPFWGWIKTGGRSGNAEKALF